MREMENSRFEFRAWDEELKFYVDPSKYYISLDGRIFFDNNGDLYDQTFKLILEQYTGRKDKNGEKIFVGDILKWDEKEWGEKYNEEVEWCYSLFDARKNDWGEWCEIIGNIHENPELLEEQ